MLKIYCDGACSGNPGPGGWAYVIPQFNVEGSGSKDDTTNNRMEITAVNRSLEYLAVHHPDIKDVEIITDSQYVVNTMTLGWKKNKNLDLWTELDVVKEKFNSIKFTWVKGHSSNQYNNRCDELAVNAYKNKRQIKSVLEELKVPEEEKELFAIEVTFRIIRKFNVNGSTYRMYYCEAFNPDFYIIDKNEQYVTFTGTELECLNYLETVKDRMLEISL